MSKNIKIDIFLNCFLVFILVSVSFILVSNKAVISQTSSSSSSSGGSVTGSSSSGNINLTSTTSSTSTGDVAPSTSSSSTSSTGGIITSGVALDKGFTGRWQAKLDRSVTINGTIIQKSSRIITFDLCIDSNGNLKGHVDQPGIFDRGVIISQQVTDSTHVKLQIEDIRNRTGSVDLTLNGTDLDATFSNGVSVVGKNITPLNPQKACLDLAILPNTPTSNPTSGTLSPDFTGVWTGDVTISAATNGTQAVRRARLKLCSANGVLSGFIDSIPRIIPRPAFIVSQTITDSTHVSLQLQDINGKAGTLSLSLNGTELDGNFTTAKGINGTVTFTNQNRLNPGTVCIDFGLLPPAGIDGMKPPSSSSGSCTCKP